MVVSILTGLERPVQPRGVRPCGGRRRVSILTGLERPVQRADCGEPLEEWPFVSILTGLERPVQQQLTDQKLELERVSILTGLERPVQRNPDYVVHSEYRCFNPHRP